jgi:protein TonB
MVTAGSQVFDHVTKQGAGRRAARSGAFLLGSTALQIALVAVVVLVSVRMAAKTSNGPVVDVKFFPRLAAPAPPPPPAPVKRPVVRPRPKNESAEKPTGRVAMVQPRQVPAEVAPPAPVEPPEADTGSTQGSDAGVPGGTDGGLAGGTLGGTGKGTGLGSGDGTEEAPQYAGSGYRKPSEVEPGCVRSAIRIPPQLTGFISGPITVKFAVGRDGSAGLVEVMTRVSDRRIAEIIRAGIQTCRWQPGTDTQGRPVRLWVIMPIRFTTG